MSRAIGDFEFKQNFSLEPEKQIVTADPEIISHSVNGEEEFLVLACDGIWDCLSSQQVIDFVRRSIAQGKEIQTICEEAMDKCLAPDSEIGGVGCDNVSCGTDFTWPGCDGAHVLTSKPLQMTICIVALLGGRTKEEWYAWVKDRVDQQIGWHTPEEIAPVFSSQSGSAGGMGIGRLGGMGGGGVLSALAGGLGGGDDIDDERPGGGLRLPGGLAGA